MGQLIDVYPYEAAHSIGLKALILIALSCTDVINKLNIFSD